MFESREEWERGLNDIKSQKDILGDNYEVMFLLILLEKVDE